MIVIGLVGRTAAGKSTVARALAALGAEVIDADRIAHDVLAQPDVIRAVTERFGESVVGHGGRVLRPVLAELVFGPSAVHDRGLADLEAIVHPRVKQEIEARLGRLASDACSANMAVVLDVPLLMQVGLDAVCDRIVHVECDETIRQQRLDSRGWPVAQKAARERAWQRGYRPPAPEKTVVVDASGNPAYTFSQVESLWNSPRSFP